MLEKDAKYFLLILILVFLGLFAVVVSGFLAPLILGILLAGLASPFYKITSKFTGRNVGAFISILAVSIIIILPLAGVLSLLVNEAINLLSINKSFFTFENPALKILEPISYKLDFDIEAFLGNQLAPILSNIGSVISKEIGSLLSNIFSLILSFFVMIVTCFYMLRDGKKLADFFIKFSPLKDDDDRGLYKTFEQTGRAIFYGTFITAIVQGILGGLGFYFFSIGSPVLWGMIMGFLALIPFLGPYIIFLPASLFLFSQGGMVPGLVFLAYNLIIVSSIDNLIRPKLISSKIKIHPLLILVAILGGLKAFGILGIIYGPVIVAIFIALLKVYLESSKKEINENV